MTMRVTIEIVPFGQESEKYPIYEIDVHNTGIVEDRGFGHVICSYKAELFVCNNETQQKLLNSPRREKQGEFKIKEHDRRDGAIELTRKVTSAFSEEWGNRDKLEEK